MPLYTIIMEFKSGTYVSQAESDTPGQVCIESVRQLDIEQVTGMTESLKEQILKDLSKKDNNPTPLKGLKNAWYTFGSTDDGLVEFNVVHTVS